MIDEERLVGALAYALARAELPHAAETPGDYAARLAPLAIQSGYLDDEPGAGRVAAAVERITYCRTCGKTRFVEWPHRRCPPDEPLTGPL